MAVISRARLQSNGSRPNKPHRLTNITEGRTKSPPRSQFNSGIAGPTNRPERHQQHPHLAVSSEEIASTLFCAKRYDIGHGSARKRPHPLRTAFDFSSAKPLRGNFFSCEPAGQQTDKKPPHNLIRTPIRREPARHNPVCVHKLHCTHTKPCPPKDTIHPWHHPAGISSWRSRSRRWTSSRPSTGAARRHQMLVMAEQISRIRPRYALLAVVRRRLRMIRTPVAATASWPVPLQQEGAEEIGYGSVPYLPHHLRHRPAIPSVVLGHGDDIEFL